ncbi:MAG TPA: hypothetical protein VGA17_05790, partial [Nitrospiraceae bacterium]
MRDVDQQPEKNNSALAAEATMTFKGTSDLPASSYVMTGFFFHQAHLAQTKGWPLTLIAGSFTAWALASVVAALITGDLVDRRGATRMMPFAPVPMCAGLAALSATDSPLAAPVYLGRGYLPGRAHDRAGRPVGRDLRRA